MGRFIKNDSKDLIMKAVCFVAACLSVLAIIVICIFLFYNGLPAMNKIGFFQFIFGKVWQPGRKIYGILPMIIGSIYTTIGAMIIGIPIGLFTAIYLVGYCPKSLYKILKPAIQLMAGIPSVIYGFFGLVVLVPIIGQLFENSGKSIITASILLGIMILPTMIQVSESAIRAVPDFYYEGAVALGADHVRSLCFVVVPAAKSGIMTAVMLGLGRAVGETMAVIMVAGNQARIPDNLTQGIRTLTTNIVLEMGYATDLHREALIATSVILLIFILLIHLLFNLWNRRTAK